jgi:hypothetical protein
MRETGRLTGGGTKGGLKGVGAAGGGAWLLNKLMNFAGVKNSVGCIEG